MVGGGGDDEVWGGGGNDIFGAVSRDGDDLNDGGSGIDTWHAGPVNTRVTIDLGAGSAIAAGSIDRLISIENAIGGSGNDSLIGGNDNNVLVGGDGKDKVSGLGGEDTLRGAGGDDMLNGGGGNDRLHGGDGVDNLLGGKGNDVLLNSFDIDRFTGNTGADRFIFDEVEEFFVITGSGLGRVTDFEQGTDLLDFSDFKNNGVPLPLAFIGTGAFTAEGQIGFRTTATATFVMVSVNVAEGMDVVRLDGVFPLAAADFLL